MLARSVGTALESWMDMAAQAGILLVTPMSTRTEELQQTLESLGFLVQVEDDAEAARRAAEGMAASSVILLDVQVPEVANGRLLAMLQESGVHRVCAIALIAEAISDEWIARLREGVIDDIVPRHTDTMGWNTHLSTMRRGHALYCELEHLRETAAMDMEYDRVTGIFNRETMLAILFRETDRVQRLHGSLCLVLLELDDLEDWSGQYGPEVADQLLQMVAKRTGRILRSYDLLGRVGREQFLLALPGCSTISAVMLAERLRVEVFGEPFAVTDGPRNVAQVRMTGSFGVSSSRGRSPVVVLREAERTLARGKAEGPDAIHCSSDSPLAPESGMEEARRLFPEVALALR